MFDLTPLIESLKPEMLTELSSTAKQAVTDGYQGIKGLISKKYGDKSDISQALQNVENKPESEARQGVLKEEWEAAGAAKDPEINHALAQLKTAVEQGSGQSIQGHHNIQVGSIGSVGRDLVFRDKIVHHHEKKNTSIPKKVKPAPLKTLLGSYMHATESLTSIASYALKSGTAWNNGVLSTTLSLFFSSLGLAVLAKRVLCRNGVGF